MTRFLFDIDGTITDSRQKIDPEFEEFMYDFCRSNKVAFVTGSDHLKTIEQIGERLFNRVEYSFNCSGNEIWAQSILVQKSSWKPPQELLDYLQSLLEKSKFPTKTGNHIEIRNGMVNFSIPGRNCDNTIRAEYVAWDKATDERLNFCKKLEDRFFVFDLDAFIGGETGIDIYPKGKNKEQVLDFLSELEQEKIYYFGDQIFKYGNDYNIAMKCDHRYSVRGWRNTYEILSFLKETEYCD